MILSAHLGLHEPCSLSHSEEGGSLLGKQLHLGSLIRSHAKIVGSSLYRRPAQWNMLMVHYYYANVCFSHHSTVMLEIWVRLQFVARMLTGSLCFKHDSGSSREGQDNEPRSAA